MQDHWNEYGPPVYVAVASYLGMTKPKKKDFVPVEPSSNDNFQALEALEQQLNSTGGVI